MSVPIAVRTAPRAELYLPQSEVRALTSAILAKRTSALTPLLATHAREAEQLRKPVDAVWEEIRKTGVFYHFVPKRFGGLEFGPEEYLDSVLPLAEGDASTAWAAGFCVHHNWIMSLFPIQAQEEFFKNGYALAPGVTVPIAKSAPVDGGYRVTARWKWGSGVMHSDWILGVSAVEGESPIDGLWVAIPAEEATVLDTWQMAGMIGTGSNDIEVNDVFVPAYRTVRQSELRAGTSPGARLHSNPIYRMPTTAFLTMAAAIPALGAAKSAVAFFREYLGKRVLLGTDIKQQEKPAVQMRLGHAQVLIKTAEMLLRDVARKCLTLAGLSPIPENERIALRGQSSFAVELCLDAVRTICTGAGSSAYNLSNPLQRAMRDVSVIASHFSLDFDTTAELIGRSILGLAPNTPHF